MSTTPACKAPAILAESRVTRRVRAGPIDEDFTFDPAVRKQGPRPATADEIAEQQMSRLRMTEPRASLWLRLLAVASAFCAAALVARGIYSFFH